MAGDYNPLQPQSPDEDLLAMLGLHPAQMAVAHGLANGGTGLQIPPGEEPPPKRAIAAPASGPRGINVPPAPDVSALPPESRGAPTMGTPVTPPTRRTELEAERQQLQKGSGIEQFQHRHPILGGTARVAAGIASAMFPGVAAAIPGTDIHHEVLVNRNERGLANELAREKEEATTAETQARIPFMQSEEEKNRAEADAKRNPPTKIVFDQGIPVAVEKGTQQFPIGDPNMPPDIKPMADAAVAAHKQRLQEAADAAKTKPDTATQNKESFQHGIGVLRGEGLIGAADVTDFKKIATAVEKSKALTADEKNTMVGYMGANPTPGTNLTVHVAGAEAQRNIRNKDKYYAYTDENGETQVTSGDKIPPNAEGVTPIKDPEALMNSARNTNLVQKSFNQLASHDLKMFDDPKARAVLTSALDENQARSFGLLVAGTGGSLTLPGGTGKIIDQLLENNAVPQQYRREVKDFIVDYYSMKDKMLTLQMDIQNGKMGRAALPMIQAMFNQLPGLATADSTMAKRQLMALQGFISGVKEKFPEKYGNYKKEPDLTFQEKGGGGQKGSLTVQAPNGKTYTFQDQASADNFKREAGIQ